MPPLIIELCFMKPKLESYEPPLLGNHKHLQRVTHTHSSHYNGTKTFPALFKFFSVDFRESGKITPTTCRQTPLLKLNISRTPIHCYETLPIALVHLVRTAGWWACMQPASWCKQTTLTSLIVSRPEAQPAAVSSLLTESTPSKIITYFTIFSPVALSDTSPMHIYVAIRASHSFIH